MKRLRLRYKKTIFATEQDGPDVALARQLWRAAQADLNLSSLVFVDVTGTNTAMTRTHGRGQKGTKLAGKVPHGHSMTSTFLAGLTPDAILAPQPEMKPGRIAVIDNLPAHKVTGIRQCLEGAGMQSLYLPRYSPGLNPIEQVFAKIKDLHRRMAPRSFDAICDALKAILEKFLPAGCATYLKHSGYVQT